VNGDMQLVVRYASFQSAYKAALSKLPTFQEQAGVFTRHLITTSVSFAPALAECIVGTKNDRPSSAELERLTRDFFSFAAKAFSAEQAVCLRAEARFDPLTQEFHLRQRRSALAIDPLSLPDSTWSDWFLHGPRCPCCALFPDMTEEYSPCRLCGYANYEHELEIARSSFLQAPGTASVIAAVRTLFSVFEAEPQGPRAAYLRHRIVAVSKEPRAAMEPLPW
jgi:hypothetical protein